MRSLALRGKGDLERARGWEGNRERVGQDARTKCSVDRNKMHFMQSKTKKQKTKMGLLPDKESPRMSTKVTPFFPESFEAKKRPKQRLYPSWKILAKVTRTYTLLLHEIWQVWYQSKLEIPEKHISRSSSPYDCKETWESHEFEWQKLTRPSPPL